MLENSREWEKRLGRERFRNASGWFLVRFSRFGGFLTVGTEKPVQKHPEPTSQIPKSPKYSLKKALPEHAPFLFPSTVSLSQSPVSRYFFKDFQGF